MLPCCHAAPSCCEAMHHTAAMRHAWRGGMIRHAITCARELTARVVSCKLHPVPPAAVRGRRQHQGSSDM